MCVFDIRIGVTSFVEYKFNKKVFVLGFAINVTKNVALLQAVL